MRSFSRFLDHAALLLVIPAMFWFAVPTSVFLDVQETRVDGTEVIFTRFTPFGPVIARWHSEIRILDGSDRECSSHHWRIDTYQERPSNTVVYQLEDWALPCIALNERYTLTTTRQVMLGGVLPLRPTTSVDTIEIPKGKS